jgi:hypothetical protein
MIPQSPLLHPYDTVGRANFAMPAGDRDAALIGKAT